MNLQQGKPLCGKHKADTQHVLIPPTRHRLCSSHFPGWVKDPINVCAFPLENVGPLKFGGLQEKPKLLKESEWSVCSFSNQVLRDEETSNLLAATVYA